MKQITLCEGGTDEKIVDVENIEIPDLWHIAMYVKNRGMAKESDMILKVWRLAYDMKKALSD